jgi:hypothetical protein
MQRCRQPTSISHDHRLIFSRYLGTDLERLEDRSYFSSWERPYQFWDVTDDVRTNDSASVVKWPDILGECLR